MTAGFLGWPRVNCHVVARLAWTAAGLLLCGRPGRTEASALVVVSVSSIRLDTQPIVHGGPELLLASQIALGRLNRHMPQEKLDLVQLSARKVAQAGAGAPVMPGPALTPSCRLPSYADSSCYVTTTSVDLVNAIDMESA
jgi:hypothetical protein